MLERVVFVYRKASINQLRYIGQSKYGVKRNTLHLWKRSNSKLMKVWKWKKWLLSVCCHPISHKNWAYNWCLLRIEQASPLRTKQDRFTAFKNKVPTRKVTRYANNMFFQFHYNTFFWAHKIGFSGTFNPFTTRISTYHTISFETVLSKCLCRILCRCVWLWGRFSLILVPPGMCCRISQANTVVQATSVRCLGCIRCVRPILQHK